MSNEETLNQTTTSAADARRQELNQTFDELKDAFKTEKTIEVEIIEKVKGGFKTKFKDVNIFLPDKLYFTQKELDENEADSLKGSKLKVKVIEFTEDEFGRIVRVSHRKVMLEEQWQGLSEGLQVEGTVKTILNQGLILDVNGIEAFVPASKISRQRIDDLNTVAKQGDVFKGTILTIEKERNRMIVGLENISNANYEDFFDKHNVGDKIKGKIRNIIRGGIFVELAPNVDGYLSPTEISWTRREIDLQKMFEIGQELETEIIEIDKQNSKINLSFKRVQPNNWAEVAEKYQVGYTYSVTVEYIQTNNSGATVSLNDEIDGFIPKNRMLALYTGNKPNFKAKDVLQVKLIEKNAEKFSLLFESIIKPENPYSNENYDRPRGGNRTEEAKSNSVSSFTFADLLSDASKKILSK